MSAEAPRPVFNDARPSHFSVVRVPYTDIVHLQHPSEFGPVTAPDYKSLGIKPPEERGSFTQGTLNVSHHEWQHAYVARRRGMRVARIEIGRQGNSFGRTILHGILPPEHFAVTAAAGSIDTPEGAAWGFGMDHQMTNENAAEHGGLSWNDARIEAENCVLELNPEQRKIAARIVASMGIVNGSLIDHIVNIAIWESENAKNEALTPIAEGKTDAEQEIETIPLAAGEYTILETLENGETKIRYVFIDEDGDEHPWLPKRKEVSVFIPKRKLRFAA